MQGKGKSLRLGLMGLVVVLVLSAVGSLSLARDAFDGNDYEDCPAVTRLDAVDGLAVDRTDEEDEIRISWDALTDAELGSLGPNGYRARLTVIVEGSGSDEKNNVALGDTSLVVNGVDFAKDLTISVAITLGDFVISDIAEKDFTSGMPAPSFSTTLIESGGPTTDTPPASSVERSGYTAGVHIQKFYYLGFNDTFDNWFVKSPPTVGVDEETVVSTVFSTKPTSAKFRVGLAHADSVVDPDDADFDHYRIVIEDSSGDLLGYQAQTVSASRTYGKKFIVFGEAATERLDAPPATGPGPDGTLGNADDTYDAFTNIRLSNRVTDGAQLSPYYATITTDVSPDGTTSGLSYANVSLNAAVAGDALQEIFEDGNLYAAPPAEYFDFPSDVFDDDGNYVLKAWAEDSDGTRISPVASIELGVQEGDPVTNSRYLGYVVILAAADPPTARIVAQVRTWHDTEANPGLELSVYSLTIQDE